MRIVQNNPNITLITMDYEFLYLTEPASISANPNCINIIMNPDSKIQSESKFYGLGKRAAILSGSAGGDTAAASTVC